MLIAMMMLLTPASGEQPAPRSLSVDAGQNHTCALLDSGQVRCWGDGADGRLGYGNTSDIGDDETPAAVAPVDLGTGRTATAISAGDEHTCALLDAGQVRCWGRGLLGQLGYANTNSIGDDETPAAAAPVDLGPGRTATAISAGGAHTCALLDNGWVRCWGDGRTGQLGDGSTLIVGDDETPAAVAPVNLGAGRTATAISAGGAHTCALLDNSRVRCWGDGANGRLGYGNTRDIGDDETPAAVAPVDLGASRTATAISAGSAHTCALLDAGQTRCWGFGANGRLGYGNTSNIGDDETPAAVAPVNLGAGRTATAISAGGAHTCTLLDTAEVRCWGDGRSGQLGYGGTGDIGDDEAPGQAGPVDLHSPVAIAPPAAAPPEPAPPLPTAPQPPPPPPAPPPATAVARVKPGVLTLIVRSRRQTISVAGKLGLPAGARCQGRVTITVERGIARVARKLVALRIRAGACRYATTLRPRSPRGIRLRVGARFSGTTQLLARSSSSRTIRL